MKVHGLLLYVFILTGTLAGAPAATAGPIARGWKTCESILKVTPILKHLFAARPFPGGFASAFAVEHPTAVLPKVQTEAPELRDVGFASLEQLMRAFSQGLVPNLDDPDQSRSFETYLKTAFGTSSQYQPDRDDLNEITTILKDNPELWKQIRFRNQYVKIAEVLPQPLPPDLRIATDRLLRAAKASSARLMNIDANIGFYRKMLGLPPDTKVAEIFPTKLLLALDDETTGLHDRAKLLFRFLEKSEKELAAHGKKTNVIHQALVDLIHNFAVLENAQERNLRSEFAGLRLLALRQILQRRDTLAMELGFTNHFVEVLETYKVYSLPGVERASELESWVSNLETLLYPTTVAPEEGADYEVRQLSVVEKPFRSCVGGSDCSSRTYLSFGMYPYVQYFTLTDAAGRSSGQMTVILGQLPGQKNPVAFIDKIQNVPNAALVPMLSAIQKSLAEFGFILYIPRDGGNIHTGISNDLSTRDTYSRLVEQVLAGPDIHSKLTRHFSVEPTPYYFDSAYSRLSDELELLPFALPGDLKVHVTPGEIDRLWRVPHMPFSHIVGATLKLREGSWPQRWQYMLLMPLLEEMGLANTKEHALLIETWLRDPGAPLRFRSDLVLRILANRNFGILDEIENPVPTWSDDERHHMFDRIFQNKERLGLVNGVLLETAVGHPEWVKKLSENWGFTALDTALNIHASRRMGGRLDTVIGQAATNVLSRVRPELQPWFEKALFTPHGTLTKNLVEVLNGPDLTPEQKAQLILDIANPEGTAGLGIVDALTGNLREDAIEVRNWITKDPTYARTYHDRQMAIANFARHCFVAGTPIETPTGPVAIENLQPGDQIVSYDFARADETIDTVKVRVDGTELRQVSMLHFSDGSSFATTDEHPVYSLSRGAFIEAAQLGIGETVMSRHHGQMTAVEVVDRERLPGLRQVFNFHTVLHHNYLANGILVHNIKEIGP